MPSKIRSQGFKLLTRMHEICITDVWKIKVTNIVFSETPGDSLYDRDISTRHGAYKGSQDTFKHYYLVIIFRISRSLWRDGWCTHPEDLQELKFTGKIQRPSRGCSWGGRWYEWGLEPSNTRTIYIGVMPSTFWINLKYKCCVIWRYTWHYLTLAWCLQTFCINLKYICCVIWRYTWQYP